jgi:outer membrane protein
MRLRHIIPFIVLAALAPALSAAQVKLLTLEESIAIGLEKSKTLHASLMRSEYAEAKSSEAAAALYPSLKVQAGYTRLSDVPAFRIPLPGNAVEFPVIVNNYTARATVSQPLYTGWKLQGAAEMARSTASAAQSDLAKDRSEFVFAVTSAYWNLYRAREVKRLSDESVSQFSRHLDDIENMMKQGITTINDVLKVKVQRANALVMQSDAENTVRIAMLSLNSLIGLPLGTETAIASPLTPASHTYPDVSALITTAMAARPDIQSSASRITGAESGIAAARGGWLPQLMLTGNYYYSRPNQRIFPAVDAFKDTWDVGISLQFDVWNNLTTLYQTDAARAQYEQAKDAMGVLKDAVVLDVTQSYLSFEQARKRIELSQLGVDQADENLRVNQEKFSHGYAVSSDLLDAEVASLQAKLQLTQALVEYELAKARVDKAVGEGN